MAKTPLTIYLDPDLAARIDAVISAGHYANASEVAEEAFSMWMSAAHQREFEHELKRAYESGLATKGAHIATAAAFLRRLGDLA